MAFLKRKRVKFSVDLQVCHLSDVPLVNAVLFAKVRLLEGGHFEAHTERVEVKNHSVSWGHRFQFVCRISSDQSTGILERCPCRVSIRKEQKGGKSYTKLGYVDINLSEFAASGVEGVSRAYLLDGYGQHHRQDNSKVLLKVTMCHQSADPFFKVPGIAGAVDADDCHLNPEERRAPFSDCEEQGTGGDGVGPVPSISATGGGGVVMRTSATETQGDGSGSSGVAEDAASVASDSRRAASSACGAGGGAGGGGAGNVPSAMMSSTTTSAMTSSSASTALRRLSQDRSSAPRLQNTRIDAEDVIASVLAESRLSEDFITDNDASQGLSLYVGRDGEAMIAPPRAQRGTLFERVHIPTSDNSATGTLQGLL